MRRTFVSVSLVLLLIVGTFATAILARQTRQEPDVLNALLVEVRGLRGAIEQMSSVSARVQLAMGRLQLNEQRITTYMRRLDDIRDRRIAAEAEALKRQQRLTGLTYEMRGAPQPIPRYVEVEIATAKAELADANATLLRFKNEEAKLLQDIATEQDRWAEINRTLEDLDRALTRR
jgi:cell division protein FtsX